MRIIEFWNEFDSSRSIETELFGAQTEGCGFPASPLVSGTNPDSGEASTGFRSSFSCSSPFDPFPRLKTLIFVVFGDFV